jgi:hypothetical protein
LFRILASYWSAGFGKFLQVLAFASHWLEDYANLRQRRRKTTNTLSAIQAASQSILLTHNYTPLVISRNDKNKQLTIIKPT